MVCKVKRVTMLRTPCYGHCPVYELAVSGDGEVEYRGEWFVAREGLHRWEISLSRVRLLAEAFERVDYFVLEDEYAVPEVTDLPSCITSIECEDGRSKSVAHYHGGSSAPEELSKLEDRIDAIVGTRKYIRIKATNPSTYLLTWYPSKQLRGKSLEKRSRKSRVASIAAGGGDAA